MKKRNQFFGIAAAVILLLCACADETPAQDGITTAGAETTPVTEEAPKYELPDTDWAGESFAMLVGEGYNECFVEEETGDALDDAKYQMKRTVEEALNVTISETPSDFWEMPKTVSQYIMAGEDTYDSIAMMDRFALQSAMENNFIPIQDIETINTDAIWWGGELSEKLSIGGNRYFAIGSQNLESFGKTACILWNTRLAASLDIEIPYEDVFAGTWTLEDFCSYRQTATADLNGDGVYDHNDQYTYASGDIRGIPSQFWQASDMNIITKDANDMPQITIWDDQKFLGLLETLHGLMYTGDNNVSRINADVGSMSNGEAFLEGRVMIYSSVFSSINQAREMNDDFAVLPIPKYDEAQASYYSRTYDATFFMVPVTQENTALSGAVLDALSCVGYYDLLPVYIDTVLKEKASRDEDSKRSIQICFDTRTLDMGEAFLFDYFGDQPIYDKVMKNNNMNLSSYLEKNRKRIDKQLQKIIDTFTDIG